MFRLTFFTTPFCRAARSDEGFRRYGIRALAVIAPTAAAAQGAVFVVRHAERADTSADSPLSTVGHTRATRLGVILSGAGITQIDTTNLRRTVQAAPLRKR